MEVKRQWRFLVGGAGTKRQDGWAWGPGWACLRSWMALNPAGDGDPWTLRGGRGGQSVLRSLWLLVWKDDSGWGAMSKWMGWGGAALRV